MANNTNSAKKNDVAVEEPKLATVPSQSTGEDVEETSKVDRIKSFAQSFAKNRKAQLALGAVVTAAVATFIKYRSVQDDVCMEDEEPADETVTAQG